MKSSTNSDRYKEPEVDLEEEIANDKGIDSEEEDEYADEIIDLGDDIQPFSMQFKLEKPIVSSTVVPVKTAVKKPETELKKPITSFPKKRGGGFDLSEMILGR